MADEQKPIFLSHSYHDKDLADRLVVLLTNGCDVSPNDILCTSLSGMNIKVGTTSFIDYLKEQLEDPALVILLITENYLASSFCLAELGAAWRMGIPCFPLAVPPISRSGIGGVLEVAQAGSLTDGSYLDQLRDAIHKHLGKQVPTDGWNYRKDLFLNGIQDVIAAIKKPDHVSRAEFERLQGQYKTALNDAGEKDAQVKKLKDQVAEFEKIIPKEQAKPVTEKYSESPALFKRYQQHAQAALKKLKPATRVALYWRSCGDRYIPKGQDEWDDVEVAKGETEVEVNEGETVWVSENDSHPRVEAAMNALTNLYEFLEEEKHMDFVHELTEERGFPIDLKNKEFWRNYLIHV